MNWKKWDKARSCVEEERPDLLSTYDSLLLRRINCIVAGVVALIFVVTLTVPYEMKVVDDKKAVLVMLLGVVVVTIALVGLLLPWTEKEAQADRIWLRRWLGGKKGGPKDDQ